MANKRVKKRVGGGDKKKIGGDLVTGLSKTSGAAKMIEGYARDGGTEMKRRLQFVYHAGVYDTLLFFDEQVAYEVPLKTFSDRLDQMAEECRKALGLPADACADNGEDIRPANKRHAEATPKRRQQTAKRAQRIKATLQ